MNLKHGAEEAIFRVILKAQHNNEKPIQNILT